MGDNIFEIETAALAHVACAPRELCILLTDFAAAYLSVNHCWIFHVLEKQLCLISSASSCEEFTTTSPRTWNLQERLGRQFIMARGVRQGCLASGFMFAMAFDTIVRLLQDSIIPRNPDGLNVLQPARCAYADDLAVDALSFRDLLTALAPAFRSLDHIAGLN